MIYPKIIFSFLIYCMALVGDFVVFQSKMAESFLFRAVSDSFVHGSLGFLSSLSFFSSNSIISSQAKVYYVLICTFFSSLIDIDHAFVAKSFHLKDYTHLKQRGIFHCTTFWVVITGILLIYSTITKKLSVYTLTWMLILAFTSHHIRDANRRGLWMYPYGHTPPLPKYLYVALVSLLPIVFGYVYSYLRPHDKQTPIFLV